MSRHTSDSGTRSGTGSGAPVSSSVATPPTGEDRAAAKTGAPDLDDPRKPDGPDDLTKPSRVYTLRKTLRKFQHDQVTDLAAALTFWAVLAVAPAAIVLVSMLGVFGDGEQIVANVTSTAEATSGMELGAVEEIIGAAAANQGAGLALLTGLLVALWSASGYVNAFSRAMNRIYDIEEGRPFWKLRPTMLLVTLVVLVLAAIVCIALVLTGPVARAAGNLVGLGSTAVAVWSIAKWPVVVVLAAFIVAILYYATPNMKPSKLKWVSVGSFVALLIWAIATVGFGFYVANFGSYDQTYGSLTGIIVFLLWLWLGNNALLFGAELDAELERSRQLQAGIKAEKSIQLPPRDTKASDKKAEKREEDVARGRRLRLSRGKQQTDD